MENLGFNIIEMREIPAIVASVVNKREYRRAIEIRFRPIVEIYPQLWDWNLNSPIDIKDLLNTIFVEIKVEYL